MKMPSIVGELALSLTILRSRFCSRRRGVCNLIAGTCFSILLIEPRQIRMYSITSVQHRLLVSIEYLPMLDVT